MTLQESFVDYEDGGLACRAPVDWELQAYAHTLHGFTNPELADSPPPGHAYDPQADERSRRAMIALLGEVFQR